MRVMRYETTVYGVDGKDVHIFRDIETLEVYAVRYDYAQALWQGWIYPIDRAWIDNVRTKTIREESRI